MILLTGASGYVGSRLLHELEAAGRTVRCLARAKRKQSTSKRERLTTPTSTQFAKRTAKGRFKEMDEVGRSQKADRRKSAKKGVKSGYGDHGDDLQLPKASGEEIHDWPS